MCVDDKQLIADLKKEIGELIEYKADAERYRHLEHLCRTGSYGGIISRKAIDESMKLTKV